MRSENAMRVSRVRGGLTSIETTAYDPRTLRPAVGVSVEFDQRGVRSLVLDLCRCAGLPEPWKKG